MKREIKFRVFFQDKWKYFALGQTWTPLAQATYQECTLLGIPFYEYTGLKDKNGVEIYEGDIVEHFGENMIVVNVHGCFYHKHKTDEAYGSMHEIHYPFKPLENDIYYIVKGDIYQNKELLTDKQTRTENK